MGKSARRGKSGQMAVELAIIMPVLLIAMVVVLDAMAFVGECARFDHVAAQAVLAQAASPENGAYDIGARTARVQEQIARSFPDKGGSVSVEAHRNGGVALWETYEFTCRFEMAPWPFSPGGLSVFGVHLPTSLTHERSVTIEPYTPGELL